MQKVMSMIDTESMVIGGASLFVPQLGWYAPGGSLGAAVISAGAWKWYKGASQQQIVLGAANGAAGAYGTSFVLSML